MLQKNVKCTFLDTTEPGLQNDHTFTVYVPNYI